MDTVLRQHTKPCPFSCSCDAASAFQYVGLLAGFVGKKHRIAAVRFRNVMRCADVSFLEGRNNRESTANVPHVPGSFA